MLHEVAIQRRGNALINDLLDCFESIAERHEEYTGENIRQQRQDNAHTCDPVKSIGAAGLFQKFPERVRVLGSCWCLIVVEDGLALDVVSWPGGLVLAGAAVVLEPAYLV